MSESTRIPLGPCPGCGYLIDAAADSDDEGAIPSPEDFTICLDCGHICRFNEDLTLRNLTEEDREFLTQFPDTEQKLNEISFIVKAMKTMGWKKRPIGSSH
jgi:hypothetical protein